MNVNTKKIIAREFLILMITLSIGLLSFISTFPYNYFINNHIKAQQMVIEKIAKTSDSLSSNYNRKTENQNYFFKELKDSGYDNYKNKEKLFDRLEELLKKDSIKTKWEKIWDKELIDFHKSLGFNTPEAFEDFISQSVITENDLKSKNESDILIINIENYNSKVNALTGKILSFEDRIKFSLWILSITTFIVFFVRYIIYGIRWSIRTLKDK